MRLVPNYEISAHILSAAKAMEMVEGFRSFKGLTIFDMKRAAIGRIRTANEIFYSSRLYPYNSIKRGWQRNQS